MAKKISFEGLTISLVDGNEKLQISVDDPDKANECNTTYLSKEDVKALSKELQRAEAKMRGD